METGEMVAVIAVVITFSLGVIALMWQMHTQSGKIEAQGVEMRVQNDRLEAKIEAKIEAQGVEMRAQNDRLEAKIEAQGAEMRAQGAEMRAQNAEIVAEFRYLRESLESRLDLDSRVRAVEREQAGQRVGEGSAGD